MTLLRVSDHAVLRYLERAGGFEIERLRAAIAARLGEAAAAGAAHVVVDGMIFVIRRDDLGPIVTTAMIAGEIRSRRLQRMIGPKVP